MASRPDPTTPDAAATMPAAAPAAAPARPPFAALIVGSSLLAVGPWFVRLADVGPVASGFWRLALALPVLAALGVAGERGRARPAGTLLLVLALGGLCFGLDLGTWHAGILRTRLANATLFGNVGSFVFVAYGFLVARRWPAARQALAIALAAAGVALLMGRSYQLSRAHLVGDLLSVAAGLFYAGYLVAIDRVAGRLGTMATLAVATAAGAATLLPIAWELGEPLWPHAWAPLIALAVGSQLVGQGLVVFAVGRLSPTVVGLGLLTQPVVASAIGWVEYREHLTLPDLLGAGMIAAALVLVRGRA